MLHYTESVPRRSLTLAADPARYPDFARAFGCLPAEVAEASDEMRAFEAEPPAEAPALVAVVG